MTWGCFSVMNFESDGFSLGVYAIDDNDNDNSNDNDNDISNDNDNDNDDELTMGDRKTTFID